ncbi:MAG: GFA family protein [Bradymonadaceae bacterium]
MAPNIYRGQCHCGRVAWEIEVDLATTRILNCNCSICHKKGFLHLIVEPENFRLLSGEDVLQEYRFNTGEAVHRFCQHCGIHSFYTPRSHPDKVDVNVRCIEGLDLEGLQIETFDGKKWENNIETIR